MISHGRSYGYRFGSVCYISDVSDIPDDTYALLEDTDLLILVSAVHLPRCNRIVQNVRTMRSYHLSRSTLNCNCAEQLTSDRCIRRHRTLSARIDQARRTLDFLGCVRIPVQTI